jgi:transposase
MAMRIVGIDLAVTGAHKASIYDSEKMKFEGKAFSFERSYEEFNLLLEKATDNSSSGNVRFVMEPTSGAWKPLSTFLIAKGYTVYLIKPQKSYDLRKFLKKHTKSDRIDSQTLAKLPIIDPEGIYPLTLPRAEVESLKRYSRQRERIVRSTSARKTRIQAFFTTVNPLLMECFGESKFTRCARAFLRSYADPHRVVKLGLKRLSAFLANHAFGCPDESLASNILTASVSAVRIYAEAKEKGALPFSPEEFQEEINIELDLMEFEEKKIKELDKKIETLYLKLDPDKVLMSIPGFGPVVAPSILGATGNPERFPNLRSYKSYCGLVSRKKQSSTQDKKGLPITKCSQRLLKKSYCLAAETARKYDPEAASLYHRLMARGRHHNQAICAVASNLSGRTFTVMRRAGMGTESAGKDAFRLPYAIRDLRGQAIDRKGARALVKEQFPSKKERERTQNLKTRQSLPQKRDNSSKVYGLSLPVDNYTTEEEILKEEILCGC